MGVSSRRGLRVPAKLGVVAGAVAVCVVSLAGCTSDPGAGDVVSDASETGGGRTCNEARGVCCRDPRVAEAPTGCFTNVCDGGDCVLTQIEGSCSAAQIDAGIYCPIA